MPSTFARTIRLQHVRQGPHLVLFAQDLKSQGGLADVQDVAAEDGSQITQLTALCHAGLDLQF